MMVRHSGLPEQVTSDSFAYQSSFEMQISVFFRKPAVLRFFLAESSIHAKQERRFSNPAFTP